MICFETSLGIFSACRYLGKILLKQKAKNGFFSSGRQRYAAQKIHLNYLLYKKYTLKISPLSLRYSSSSGSKLRNTARTTHPKRQNVKSNFPTEKEEAEYGNTKQTA